MARDARKVRNRTASSRELRKTIRFYVLQRWAELKRAVPVQIMPTQHMIDDCATEENLSDILVVNLEILISKLWWVMNLGVGLPKNTEFPS